MVYSSSPSNFGIAMSKFSAPLSGTVWKPRVTSLPFLSFTVKFSRYVKSTPLVALIISLSTTGSFVPLALLTFIWYFIFPWLLSSTLWDFFTSRSFVLYFFSSIVSVELIVSFQSIWVFPPLSEDACDALHSNPTFPVAGFCRLLLMVFWSTIVIVINPVFLSITYVPISWCWLLNTVPLKPLSSFPAKLKLAGSW